MKKQRETKTKQLQYTQKTHTKPKQKTQTQQNIHKNTYKKTKTTHKFTR